jgi:hypothetical protein
VTSGEVAWLLQYELCGGCVRSLDEIRIVLWGMRNGSRVAAELYINRMLFVLEDFLFLFLYSFTCIAKQVTTLKQLRLLSCPDLREMSIEHPVLFLMSH